jgi:hypothetical protein
MGILMKRIGIFLLFIFILGAACSFIPLSIHLTIMDSKSPQTGLGKALPTTETQTALVVEESPASIASEVMEKISGLTSKSSALQFPTPEIPSLLPTPETVNKSPETQNAAADRFVIQSPAYLSNFLATDESCEKVWIGGQVFGADGQTLENMVVIVNQVDSDHPKEYIGYSGATKSFGPAGYEIQLDSIPAEQIVTIQLFDKQGVSLSTPFGIKISPSCEKNLVIVNFVFDDLPLKTFLPIINY